MAKVNDKHGMLTEAERDELSKILTSKTETAARARRATILLDLDQGMSTSEIASVLGLSPRAILNLHERFNKERLDALNDSERLPPTLRMRKSS